MSLATHLNALDESTCAQQLAKCCAAEAWGRGMLSARPFADDAAVHRAAAEVWHALDRAAWFEAFAAHPPIGDLDALRDKYRDTRDWAGGEQAGAAGADEQTLRRLAEGNRRYLQKFGYLFIVCATGKTARQMLAMLESRLENPPEVELPLAAGEQLKITQLRLDKLVS